MAFRSEQVRHAVQDFDFQRLFIEELGWDLPPGNQSAEVGDRAYDLEAVAEKSGLVAFVCRNADVPERAVRMKIERQVAKQTHEHLLVFVDDAHTRQVWQWVKRQPGRSPLYREHAFRQDQTGEPLIQKLQLLAFSLDEDPSIAQVAGRAGRAFDVDRVTKRFYTQFKAEHDAFLEFVEGIPATDDREWYTSLMLDRLMFVYFVQKKGFLDGDHDYLRNRLRMIQQSRGPDQFLSFYHHFLRRFFHEGLGQQPEDRASDMDALIGKVPYLNGGIFDVHELEQRNPDIQIDDSAFERLFDFFDAYQWHLDERPLRADNEVNPDVLGYIFEKYVNQKQMGAYYTKEDITGYIAQNTVIPRLFDMARKDCAIAFQPSVIPANSGIQPDAPAVWRLLSENPDRYIYPAMQKGVDQPLPAFVADGLDDVAKRSRWNEPADAKYALPTETWREHVARRQRHDEVWEKLVAGEVHQINDLITLNLDIRQFAQDVILDCEGPDLLRALWKAIRNISVLDPACGSGAFLFASLNVLEPLYDACLERMEAFVAELEQSGAKHRPAKYSDFREILREVQRHPNRRYYILKSIVIDNLYGVDIMEEAVEICKLRLFLKLAAQADTVDKLEPLPDIDFNVRAGNTLVGFTSLDAVRRAMTITLDGQQRQVFPDDQAVLDRIEEEARLASAAFNQFRWQQTLYGGEVTAADKANLRQRLGNLSGELNRHLASEYRVDPADSDAYAAWRDSHKPFHWLVEFYGIMTNGGFDVIIGNPPYIESKNLSDYKVRGFTTETCGDLYAYMLERTITISQRPSWVGHIVPLSSFSVKRFAPLQRLYSRNTSPLLISHWSGDAHPSKLFEGVNKRLSIVVARHQRNKSATQICTSTYLKWYAGERPIIFSAFPDYETIPSIDSVWLSSSIPKISSLTERRIMDKLKGSDHTIKSREQKGGEYRVYYTRKVSFFLQFLDFVPAVRDEFGAPRMPSELRTISFEDRQTLNLGLSCLSTSLFYWYNIVNSDCRNLNKREVESFPLPYSVPSATQQHLARILDDLMQSYKDNSSLRTVRYKGKGEVTVQYFDFRPSKPIIDELDRELAEYYGLTEEELDFIINYDIKYRMGRER